jgi:hypothetical protein
MIAVVEIVQLAKKPWAEAPAAPKGHMVWAIRKNNEATNGWMPFYPARWASIFQNSYLDRTMWPA